MDAFPAFVPLAGARVIVAGEGEAAEAKARLFAGSPAELVRLSCTEALEPHAFAGARLAFVAGEAGWAARAAEAARAAGAWVNAVDRPELCDFNTPGIVDRGAVVGAVGTAGAAPVLTVKLRQELEARWPQGLGGLARLMEALRPEIRDATDDWAERRRLLLALTHGSWAEAALTGEADAAEALAREALEAGELGAAGQGAVWVLPASSQPDMLSLRDARTLGRADRLVIVGDVDPGVLDLARRDAPREPWTGDAAPLLGWREAGETIVVVGEVEPVREALRAEGVEPAGG